MRHLERMTATAGDMLADAALGRNGPHLPVGSPHRSVFGRLAGSKDANDAERLCQRTIRTRWRGGRSRTCCGPSPGCVSRQRAGREQGVEKKHPEGRALMTG